MERIVVTGGAGFIGSEVVRQLISQGRVVLNVDCLTYAGHRASLRSVENHVNYQFAKVDIVDKEQIRSLFDTFKPDAVLHLAAESHVDRSIDGPAAFIHTNIMGTYVLLEEARRYLATIDEGKANAFRFITVSTDEVFGSLGETGKFTETTPYDPSSPYSASKASADHLTRAWHRTFGLPTLVTNCSNNYGPYQFPEKLIPLTIQKMINEQPIPIYGNGSNIRDWLYVGDHVNGILKVLTQGRVGETYNIGGHGERTNLQVAKTLCSVMDELRPRKSGKYQDLITFVKDRPGHDFRYAIDSSKITNELGWKPAMSFESGMGSTVRWYLENTAWLAEVMQNRYSGQRLGSVSRVQ